MRAKSTHPTPAAQPVRGRVARLLEERQARGELRACDAREAAILFHDMMAFDFSQQLLLGIMRPPKAPVVEAKVRSVVEAFLNGFAHEREQTLSSGGQHTAAVAALPDQLKVM